MVKINFASKKKKKELTWAARDADPSRPLVLRSAAVTCGEFGARL